LSRQKKIKPFPKRFKQNQQLNPLAKSRLCQAAAFLAVGALKLSVKRIDSAANLSIIPRASRVKPKLKKV